MFDARTKALACVPNTVGRVVTRFPPEPNGHLHIGHSKAMCIDFGLAAARGGECILRFDDTNPHTESTTFEDGILEDVQWMGFRPDRITRTSDHFEQLFEYAKVLIEQGDAYVCNMSAIEMGAGRRDLTPSPWRGRPPHDSLALFEGMQAGTVTGCTLRLRTPDLMDLVAYRVKPGGHARTGDRWRVYPSYDMSHCVVDSLEGITHSLCSKEFEIKRSYYYWLLDALKLRKPLVIEFSRLKIPSVNTSKRGIACMVARGDVDGWDDPRLFTLAALRRKGWSPHAVRRFCEGLGVTNSDSEIGLVPLLKEVRAVLNETAPRTMAVLDPLKVVIINMKPGARRTVEAKRFPGGEGPTYNIALERELWIERSDFRTEPPPKFWGLAPGRKVLLKYAGVIRHVRHDEEQVYVEFLELADEEKPPKGVLHWVPAGNSAHFAMWDITSTSPPTTRGALCLPDVLQSEATIVWQFERQGYFKRDPGSGTILKTCNLRESFSQSRK